MGNEQGPFPWSNSQPAAGNSSGWHWQGDQPSQPIERPAEPPASATSGATQASFTITFLDINCSVERDGDYIGWIPHGETASNRFVNDDYDEPASLSKSEAREVDAEFREIHQRCNQFFRELGYIPLPTDLPLDYLRGNHDAWLGICPTPDLPFEDWPDSVETIGFAGPPRSKLVRAFHIECSSYPEEYPTLEEIYEAILKSGIRRVGLPWAEETLAQWIDRVGISAEELRRKKTLLERVGGEIDLYEMVAPQEERDVEFIIPGLLPRGMVTLLVGSNQTGKSTMMDELCAKLECPLPGLQPEFLGVPVPTGLRTVFISGEDPRGIFSERRFVLSRTWGESDGLILDARTKKLHELLPLLRQWKADLIVIDPARRFIEGNEDDSANINAFFEELEELNEALEERVAIVLIHHCKKGPPARRLADIMPRGSGVIMDRPRVAWGMFRLADGTTGVGLLKRNIPLSIPMWELGQARYFRINPETLCLDPVGKVTPPRPEHQAEPGDSGLKPAVLAAIGRLNALDQVVQQTGKRELFHLELPELAGISRSKIRETVAALIADGQVQQGARGLVAKTA
ncbi:AAA family ATPase [Novosphingobium sp.]|uniref:AAA family ATPase n=1 Tax=Novosphingobium sp. TaxID=1874826 RepID=UPI0035B091E7